jgi:hypothetical protein
MEGRNVRSIRRHLVLVDVEATELLVVPFAADGGGMGPLAELQPNSWAGQPKE